MEAVKLYPLQPKQLEFANTFAKYRLYGGAKGGGKSYAMRAECSRQCLSAPGVRGLALRRTSPEIRENMVVPMLKELPRELYKYNGSDNILTFGNGSTLRFSYCQNIQDVLNYQGIEYDFICIEELTHWTEDEFKILMSSLRTARKGIKPNFFGSTNPGGKGHAWVKRLFVDRQFKEGENPADYAFISAKVWDNAILLETQPEYVEDLQALPETKRRAYLEGDWNVFEGQYFKEFRESLHVIDPVNPSNARRRVICLDYGFTNPSAVYWLAQDNHGDVVCYRELYVTGLTYKQLALRVKAMTPASEQISVTVVDPAIVNKPSETTGTSGSDEMKAVGLRVKGADNSRLKGWQVVRQFLQPYEDPNSKQVTASLKITSNCSNLIRTLPELVHDKTDVEDLDSKGEDHAADALRYGLVELGARTKSLEEVRTLNEAFRQQAEQGAKKTAEFWKPTAKKKSDSRKTILNSTF